MSNVKKRGRKTDFTQEKAHKIVELFKAGKTEEEVSRILGIHVNTLYNWKLKNAEFLWAVREAKEVADDLVEAALFTRAVGFEHKSVKIMSYEGHSFEHEYTERVPPDTNAAYIWLRNRRPEKWKEKSELEVSTTNLAEKIAKGRERLKK